VAARRDDVTATPGPLDVPKNGRADGAADQRAAGKVELKLEFVELRAKGHSYAKIARRLKLAKSTLANWGAELEAEIARYKAIELEALLEQYYLQKEGRIRLLGEQVKALAAEIKRRDLSQVGVDRLLELLLKYYGELKAEYVDTKPLSDQEIARLRSQEDGIGTKLDGQAIAGELQQTLLRYRTGLIDREQATKETTLLLAQLKAREQEEIETKLDRIAAVLEGRRERG